MIIYGEYVKSNMYAKKYFLRNGGGAPQRGAGDGFAGCLSKKSKKAALRLRLHLKIVQRPRMVLLGLAHTAKKFCS